MTFLPINDDDLGREADLLFERHRPDPDLSTGHRCEHCREAWPCAGIRLAERAYKVLNLDPARHRGPSAPSALAAHRTAG